MSGKRTREKERRLMEFRLNIAVCMCLVHREFASLTAILALDVLLHAWDTIADKRGLEERAKETGRVRLEGGS